MCSDQSGCTEYVMMTTAAALWLLSNTPNELICCGTSSSEEFGCLSLERLQNISFYRLSPMADPHHSLPAWHVAVNLVGNQNKGGGGLFQRCPHLILMFGIFKHLVRLQSRHWMWLLMRDGLLPMSEVMIPFILFFFVLKWKYQKIYAQHYNLLCRNNSLQIA